MTKEAAAASRCLWCTPPVPGMGGGLCSFGRIWHRAGDCAAPADSCNGDAAMEAVLLLRLLPATGWFQFHAGVPDEERDDTAKEQGVRAMPARSAQGVAS
mmetsp:Transcript_46746/g.93063  ORF Transcript_46746/g.93063 Transcript_46746/m.93063 type:complete len:100 (-) Transcript_46746:329-628(-)